MFRWFLITRIALTSIIISFGESARCRYHREIADWAEARGWTFREGSREPTWTTPLPQGSNKDVNLQVDGALAGHAFTIMYVHEVRPIPILMMGAVPSVTDTTVVVVYLPRVYPAVAIKPRSLFRRHSTSGTIGYPAFDKKFQISTLAPGDPSDPAVVISTPLAEAHLNRKVPPWTLRDRELMCHLRGRPEAKDLDAMLARALWVAKQLTTPIT